MMELIVSDFIVNTCRVNPKPMISRLYALLHCFVADIQPPERDGDFVNIGISSGSWGGSVELR